MSNFKIPVCQPMRKRAKGQEDTVSSSASMSSCCPQQTHSAYDYITNLYKNISLNASKNLQNNSELSRSIKAFGETVLRDELNSTAEWQLRGFMERHRTRVAKTMLPKSTIQKRVMNFERWWVVLTSDRSLCIQGFLEKKSGLVQTEPVIKRMDFYTVATRNSLCKLKTFGGGGYGLPAYIKERFAFGFPTNWVQLRKKWILFLQAGKPQDFQWEENRDEVSADDVYLANIPSEQSSLENSCEGFTDNIQKRNFAFSSLIGKSKVTGRAVGHTSNADTVGNHGSENRGRLPDSQGKRDTNVIPECSNTDTSTKNYLLATKESFTIVTDDSGNSSDADIGIVGHNSNADTVRKRGSENRASLPCLQGKKDSYVIPECSGTDKTTKKSLLATKESSKVATDDSENSTDADTDIENWQTNCQVLERNHDQYENMQQLPITRRKNNTSQASQVQGPPTVSANVELESAPRASLSSQQVSPPVAASIPKKRGRLPKVRTPHVVLERVELEPPSVASTSSRQASPPVSVTASVPAKQKQLPQGTEILLNDWLPILVKGELCFKGTRVTGKTKTEYTTSAVNSRVDKDTVKCRDGTKCRLVGPFTDKDNCLPANIRSEFRSGIPSRWRKHLFQWINFLNNEESAGARGVKSSRRGGDTLSLNQQPEILKKSRSGRILVKPVNYWLGETYSSVISSVAIEKQRSNTPEEGPKDSLTMPASDESETVNKRKAQSTKNVKNSVNAKRRRESLDVTPKKKHKKQEPYVSDEVVNNTKQQKESLEKTTKKSHKKQEPPVSDEVVNNTKQKKESLEKTTKKSHKKQEPSVLAKVVNNTKKKKESLGKTAKKIHKKQEPPVPMKKFDMNMDFTDFVGRPPRTMKQRKKLDDIVKTLSQKEKKNTDIFDGDSIDAGGNSNVVWDEFISLKNVQSFNIGELTPHSKMLNGTFLKTPVTSPMSTSLFQMTPCKSDEVLRYVHQQKTKDDKPNKKNNTRQKKTPFLATLVGNQAADDVYAALLSGDPLSNLMNKEISDDSSLTPLSD